ncbi:MAG: hypothetical protein MPW14_05755 [Candidatus Manganitrophus sp.]|nr:MAG: hypothetical protein MPW14_05755 [Candidatus Manganitrophus sp.]
MEKIKKKGMPPGLRVALSLALFYLFLRFIVQPPLPFSVIFMYMAMALAGAIMYLTLFFNIKEVIVNPIYTFLGGGVEGESPRGAICAPGRHAVGRLVRLVSKVQ